MLQVRSTTNPRPGEQWSPLSGPWSCWGSATGGCPSGQKGFRKAVPLRPNTWSVFTLHDMQHIVCHMC